MKYIKTAALLLAMILVFVLASCEQPEVTDAPALGDEPIADVTQPRDGHEHKLFETVVSEPTCSSSGRSMMKCECGYAELDSEKLLPLAPHKANPATCTEDSVCSECGKLLEEKYDHVMIETVLVQATCDTEGLIKKACYRCGESTEIKVASEHDLDSSKLLLSDDSLGGKCTKCGNVVGYTVSEPVLKLDFEDSSEASAYPKFSFNYPATEGGAAKPGGHLWIGYDVNVLKSLEKYMVSFDFMLTADGLTDKGESLFSFIGGVTSKMEKPGTTTAWGWAFKYYENGGLVSTVLSGFNGNNSCKVEKGVWNNFVGIVDNPSRTLQVYINGTYIGQKTIHDYNDPAYGEAFSLRLYDQMPVNGTSDPKFDNFVIAEIK